MAGTGWFNYEPNQILTAQSVQEYIQDQAIQVYENSSARDSALGNQVAEGMVVYLSDSEELQVYARANAGDLSKLPYTPLAYNRGSGKNVFLNGAFQILQRSRFNDRKSAALVNDGRFYVHDQWAVTAYFTGSVGAYETPWEPNECPVPAYSDTTYLKVNSAIYQTVIDQRIENVSTLNGEQVTVSFYARSTAPTYKIRLTQNFGVSGSLPVVIESSFIANANVAGTEWVRYQATFSLPTTIGKTIGANNYLMVEFISPSLLIDIDFWGAQLEIGATASEFNTACSGYAAELQACQRYFYRIKGASGDFVAEGVAITTTRCNFAVLFPTPMRVAPSIATNTGFASADEFRITNTVLTVNVNRPIVPVVTSTSTDTVLLQVDTLSATLVVGNSYFLSTSNSGSDSLIDFSSEL
jgi:hypothetical protein